MTRVVFIGNFAVPFTTESYLAKAFRENDCEVTEIAQDHAFNLGPEAFADLIVTGALSQPRADLVLYTRTHNKTALGPSWTNAWTRLRRAGISTASRHLDRFFDLPRERLIHDGDPLFTVDLCITADGGSQERFAKAGVNHVYMPPGVDREEAEWGGTPRNGWQFDVVFIGSSDRTYHPEYPQRGELLRRLHATYGQRFAHFGHGGTHPGVRQRDLNDVLAGCKVVVGDSCFANEKGSPRSASYLSDRVPESLGRSTGAVLIHPFVPYIRNLYSGSELATHVPGDWDDLDARVGEMLANPGEREGFVTRGRARTLRDHTYTVQAAEMLRLCGLPVADSVRS